MFGNLGLKKCQVCGQKTKDVLVSEGQQRQFLCRNHLMEEFKKCFVGYGHKMVLMHPELQKVCGTLYAYYPLVDLARFNFSDSEQIIVSNQIATITGNCLVCGQGAQVWYFKPGLLEYSSSGPLLATADGSQAEWLCAPDAWEKIGSTLMENPHNYTEGLYCPHNGSGIYLSTYL